MSDSFDMVIRFVSGYGYLGIITDSKGNEYYRSEFDKSTLDLLLKMEKVTLTEDFNNWLER